MWESKTLIFQKLHIYMHKKYQEKWENAYLRVKNGYWLPLLARLRFASWAKSREKISPPARRPDPGSATALQSKHVA